MDSTVSSLIKIFVRGLGLRISLSFLPPIALAWTFFALYLRELADHRPELLGWAAVLGLVGVAVGSVVVFWLILTTIPPIRRIIDVTGTLARGELAVDIPFRDRSDETGELARALDVFKQHVAELAGCAAIKAEKETDLGRKRELLSLADALEGEVEGTIKEVMAQAETMTRSTGDAATAIRRMESLYQTLNAASGETLTNISAVAASSDELASASREIASQMARTIAITGEAVTQANEADSTMRELSRVSTRIVEVLQLINDIASQTNLLALNATIEAARAGDAGKGFAVVASEVKVLAGQTAKAVGTIAEQVNSIQAATENGVRAIDSVGRTIDEVNSVATAVAAAVEQQEASTRVISSRAQDAAEQAERVAQNAAGISTEVLNVDSLASLVEKGALDVTNRLNNMERRLSGILAHTVGGDQKNGGHAGQPLTGSVRLASGQQPCRLEAVEVEGARLTGPVLARDAEIDLSIDGFGPIPAKVRDITPTGAAVEFVLDTVTRARIGEFLYGHQAPDQPFIKLAKAKAREVEQIFETALTRGDITLDDLFDRDYKPIANTDPQQFTTRFLDMADKVLPPIQEDILKVDPRIMFGLAINQDGYVSAHQAHCSKPQGPDPVWNAANCRNRRIFNNRAELAGVTHTQDHLLQTYIRDMGGGKVMLLKDASVPITVRGRHWGGLRLGYRL